jgi:hypothetical protein
VIGSGGPAQWCRECETVSLNQTRKYLPIEIKSEFDIKQNDLMKGEFIDAYKKTINGDLDVSNPSAYRM